MPRTPLANPLARALILVAVLAGATAPLGTGPAQSTDGTVVASCGSTAVLVVLGNQCRTSFTMPVPGDVEYHVIMEPPFTGAVTLHVGNGTYHRWDTCYVGIVTGQTLQNAHCRWWYASRGSPYDWRGFDLWLTGTAEILLPEREWGCTACEFVPPATGRWTVRVVTV